MPASPPKTQTLALVFEIGGNAGCVQKFLTGFANYLTVISPPACRQTVTFSLPVVVPI